MPSFHFHKRGSWWTWRAAWEASSDVRDRDAARGPTPAIVPRRALTNASKPPADAPIPTIEYRDLCPCCRTAIPRRCRICRCSCRVRNRQARSQSASGLFQLHERLVHLVHSEREVNHHPTGGNRCTSHAAEPPSSTNLRQTPIVQPRNTTKKGIPKWQSGIRSGPSRARIALTS